jgi:hypothetical protein
MVGLTRGYRVDAGLVRPVLIVHGMDGRIRDEKNRSIFREALFSPFPPALGAKNR